MASLKAPKPIGKAGSLMLPASPKPLSRVCVRPWQRPSQRPLPSRVAVDPTEIMQIASGASTSLLDAVNSLAVATPETFRPVVTVLGGDLASIVALHPNTLAIPRLGALWYFLFSSPTPTVHIIDFYVTGPIAKALETKFSGLTFSLRNRLGGGNFGTTYEAVLDKEKVKTAQLTKEQKTKRVVVKKVNIDGTYNVRRDLLKQGTLAKGAVETGVVEAYMCRKISRFPWAKGGCADFLAEYKADISEGGISKGGDWLVWSFESDSTLTDALDGGLGKFPESVADLFLGAAAAKYEDDVEKRDALVVKNIMKQALQNTLKLHKIGIVHRDLKPENMLITVEGKVKIIDLGAAVDFTTGINFNPLSGMLDPRYSPPEDLITPINFPRAPAPFFASLFAPLAWQTVRPDLFDSFSLGMLLLQMGIPQLRPANQQRLIKQELEQFDFDLYAWRKGSKKSQSWDFSLLDRNNGAGFELAAMMLKNRTGLLRGRYSVSQALSHRFFRTT